MPREASERADYKRYRSYYLEREKSPAGVKKRVEREQARRAEIKTGALRGTHDPRTVDHKKPLARGGGNAPRNLQVVSAVANRRKYDH